MPDPEILPPKEDLVVVNDVRGYLEAVEQWQKKSKISEEKFLSGVWFRGNGKHHDSPLRPGVYRKSFTERAQAVTSWGDEGEKRLHLERQMLQEFRTSGAAYLDADNVTDVYL